MVARPFGGGRLMSRLSVRRRALLAAFVAIALLGWGYLWLAGSAVVVDETGGVESAYIVAGPGWEQPLHQLWNGYFYAIPRLEGSIEVRCRDGTRKIRGYVTSHAHTKLRVVGETPCARLVEER
jgi:hypothetical protein